MHTSNSLLISICLCIYLPIYLLSLDSFSSFCYHHRFLPLTYLLSPPSSLSFHTRPSRIPSFPLKPFPLCPFPAHNHTFLLSLPPLPPSLCPFPYKQPPLRSLHIIKTFPFSVLHYPPSPLLPWPPPHFLCIFHLIQLSNSPLCTPPSSHPTSISLDLLSSPPPPSLHILESYTTFLQHLLSFRPLEY